MTEIVVKETENEEQQPIKEEEPSPMAQIEDKPEETTEQPLQEKPTPAPKPKRVRPSRAKPPFDLRSSSTNWSSN